MKKIILLLSVIFLMIAGCKKDLTEYNDDPKNPKNVPSYTLFSNAQRTLANTLTSSNVNLNIFRLIVQYWQETTYTDESNYDLSTREINDAVWNALFRDVLADFQESARLVPTDVSDPTTIKNQLAINEIMQVYTWYYLVTTYGDIPYTEALNIDKPFPKYDDAQTIYNTLLTRLNTAINNLDVAGESYGSADILYNGDVAKWKKFANSFKLKMGITIVDSDNATAKSTIESAVAGGVFEDNDDNAEFQYLSGPPNTNPIWVDLVQSGRKDFVAASTIIEAMLDVADPRLDNFFTFDAGDGYSGGTPGLSSNYATYSKPDESIIAADFPALFLDYAEVKFILAEAAQRGFTVGGTAAAHYADAVTASIEYWGGTETEATTYLARPGVAYSAANYKKSIGVQKWIALYNRGWDAWIEWRRLDFPELEPAADAFSDIPLRFPYPVNEQNVNRLNYEAAATAIGGDDVATPLWWDKF